MGKMLCTELMTYNDTLYQIYRKVRKGEIKENHILDVRDMWNCDKVLKTRNKTEEMYLFLIECPDAIIIDEDAPTPTPLPKPSDQ